MEEVVTNAADEGKASPAMTFADDDVLICAAKRTPLGAFLGQQASVSATDMGAAVVSACVEQAGFSFTCDLNDSGCDDSKQSQIDSLYMGCVLPAGLGQAPARQTALFAGLPQGVPCTTINKVCGSGMKSAMLAHDEIRLGQSHAVIAGGMESMSQAPHMLPNVRSGQRFGHGQMLDHLYLDGLEDAYSGRLMGCFADDTAEQFDISRAQMDAFALHSLTQAKRASNAGDFNDEMVPLTVVQRGKESIISRDEIPFKANEAKIPQLKPAFGHDGRVTAANASAMSDGAAALLLMSGAYAKQCGVTPLAKVLSHTTHARAPAEFTQAPVGAITKLLAQLGWQTSTPDLYEINEAFAMVTLLAIQQLVLDPAKVNVHGGACALGHPLGATGARILVTLLYALRQRGGGRGVASLCIGGGEATAMAIETL